MIDSHCHLFEQYFPDPSLAIQDAFDAGLSGMVLVGITPEDSREALALAKTDSRLGATVGFHPHEAASFKGEETLEILKALLEDPSALALGEIGLDYFKGYSDPEVQKPVVAKLLPLAKEQGKPVIFHCRDAYQDLGEMVKAEGLSQGIVHCFTGQYEDAKLFVDLGFHISFSGILTYPSARHLKEVARKLPLDRLLIETDSPYLAPQAVRGKPNHPKYLTHTLKDLAEVLGRTMPEVEALVDKNLGHAIGFHPAA